MRKARFREKMGMRLAPRYEQAPPRHRTLSSSDSKGSGSTSLFILKYPVCCKGEEGTGQVRRGVRYDFQLLQPGSPTLSSQPVQEFYLCRV